jgi:hypothetical protein
MKRQRHVFLIDAEAGDRLKAVKARSGLSESERLILPLFSRAQPLNSIHADSRPLGRSLASGRS